MKTAWMDAYAATTASRQEVRERSNQKERIRIYEREERNNKTGNHRIEQSQRINFRRKIYDRTAEDDTVYALDGYFVPSSTVMKETEETVALINTSLVWRDLFCYNMDYTHSCETGRNVRVPPDIVKTIWNYFVRPSSGSPAFENVHLSGSNFEGLDVPPAIKGVRLQENGNTVTLVEHCDTDVMVVVGGVSLGDSDVPATSADDGTVEIDKASPGYLRIRLSESFLRQNAAKLAHCIDYPYLRNDYFKAMYNNDLRTLFEKANLCQEEATPAAIISVETKGPAFNLCTQLLTSTTPGNHPRYILNDFDIVFALKHSAWPSAANEWLRRRRRFGWPSTGSIERIKSYGSYVVATSHDLSDRPDVEFRFSFSVAEHLLAEELSVEQKQCYVSFKSAIKHIKQELECQLQTEIKVKSYHLKNIFLWACETVPAEEFQSPSGWTKCFLFLIDQLLHCLREKVLPGYFITRYNLFDAVSSDVLDCLTEKVSALSRNPFSTVTNFLNTLVLYSGLRLNEVLHTTEKITDIKWGLELLQRLVVAFDVNDRCRFWKKSCALKTFASWCKSHLASTLSRCISPKMTLFDIVHLDIVHQFQIDNSVLKEFSDRESSADVVNKLALCYVGAAIDAADGASYSEKAMFLFRQSIKKRPSSLVNVIAFASFLYNSEKYEDTLMLLKSANQQVSESQFENIFEEARKIESLMEDIGEEIEELAKFGTKYLPAVVPIYNLLLKCSRHLDMQDVEGCLLKEFETFCNQLEISQSHLSWCILGISYGRIGMVSQSNEYLRRAVHAKLKGDVKPRSGLLDSSGKCPHAMISIQYVFFMFSVLMPENGTPALFKSLLEETQLLVHNMPFTGSNLSKVIFLLIDHRWIPGDDQQDRLTLNSLYANVIKWSATSNSPTLSNRLYYCQFLMNCTTGRPARPILLDIILKAKKNSLSVIVWPKKLRSAVDDYIGRELDSISEGGCSVIPTIVYGHYLLAALYMREKRTSSHAELMLEFQSLCREFESVYPPSYSLLGYTYEQSGDYVQAVSSHSRARELLPDSELVQRNLSSATLLMQTDAPIVRSTSNERTRLLQERGSEAIWQMYSGLLGVVPDASMMENPEEMMRILETGRTVDECYSCRFAE